MANGRVITRRITTNEQLGRVSPKAALLFTWAIPHLDVDGRITGNPTLLKAVLAPLRPEVTETDIPGIIEEWETAIGHEGDPLARSYTVGSTTVLQFPGFVRIQKVRREREAPSKLPPPPGGLREDSGRTPAQGQGEVQVQGQGESANGGRSTKDGAGLNALVAKVLEIWKAETGGVYPFGRAKKEVMRLHGTDSPDTILAHFREYVRQHSKPDQRKFLSIPSFVSRFGLYAPAGHVPEAGDASEARYQYLVGEARRGIDMDAFPDWPQYRGRYLGRGEEVAGGKL